MQTEPAGGDARQKPNPFEPPSVPVSARRTLGLRKRFEDFETAPPAPSKPVAAPPVHAPWLRGRRLGDILVAMGALTPAQVQAGVEEARLAKEPLGRHLIARNLITAEQLCRALSLQSGLPVVDFPTASVPVAAKYGHLLALMHRLELAPFSETDLVICVAAKRPPSPQRLAEIERAFKKKARVCLAPDAQLDAILHTLAPRGPVQKRRHPRHKITMPIWLQLCGERNETLGLRQGGQITDISMGGLRVDAPDVMLAQIKQLRHGEPHLLVRFSTPPLDVYGTCVVRHVRRKENARPGENMCILGLEFKTLGPAERENFRQLHERAEIAAQRLEVEFGPGHV